ncbi:hypothetical protein BpHYR1_020342, partial [Brachionus plicatilis]
MKYFDQNWKIVDLQKDRTRSLVYICFLIIALAVDQKYKEMLLEYNKDPIAAKAKEGRKANGKKCLESNKNILYISIFDKLHHKAAEEPQPKFNGAAAVFQFPQRVEQLLMEERSNCCKRVEQHSKA